MAGWVCGLAPAPLYLACSTHLSSTTVPPNGGEHVYARQQLTEFRKMLDWKNANQGPAYGAGDFNLVWDEVKPEFCGRYADTAPGSSPYTYDARDLAPNPLPVGGLRGKKIDFMFLPGQDVPALKAPIHWCATAWWASEYVNAWNGPLAPTKGTSDHLMHWGYANLC